MTPLTELAGLFWKQKLGDAIPAGLVQVHQWLGLSILLVLVPRVIWRGRFMVREQIPTPSYFLLALVLVIALMLQGNLGGRMIFG